MAKRNRAIVVVERGWIFAGDVTRENGRIRLDRAMNVFHEDSIAFAEVVGNPKSRKVKLTLFPHGIDLPERAEIISMPVPDDWGLDVEVKESRWLDRLKKP